MKWGFWLLAASFLTQSSFAEEYLIRFKTPDAFKLFMNFKSAKLQSVKSFFDCKIRRTFSFGSFRALSIDVPKDLVDRIRRSPLVAEVVPNIQFVAYDEHDFEAWNFNSRFIRRQRGAPRHLSRLSRRSQLPYDFEEEDDNYEGSFNYYYDNKHRGDGINAYIIDTGIYKEHAEFGGRAVFGEDLTGEGPGDGNGHGTHVAGIVGSSKYGVAKDITLVEVKALTAKGQGNLTTVISAMEFAVNHCRSSEGKGCVINLSLGAIRNSVINQAVKAAHEAGIVVVVAAGNSNINACLNSPASAPEAITVGAFDDRTDSIAKFSNWGSCVDIFAPGVRVKSLASAPHLKPILFSGTSMASPSITGLAAILLDEGVPYDKIKDYILKMATNDVFQRRTLVFKPGTPNRVAFNGVKKNDDKFSNAVYPVVDLDLLIEDLKDSQ